MANIRKFGLALAEILFASCILLSLFASADPLPSPSAPDYLPTPSVPSFNVSFVNRFSNTPVQTKIDPYNGSVIIISDPSREKGEIEIKIANQQFSSYIRGYPAELRYIISYKGFYETMWLHQLESVQINNDSLAEQQYTVLYLQADYRVGDKIDFKVQAVAKYQYAFMTTAVIPNHPPIPTVGTAIGYKSSNWSQTQTFTMPDTTKPLATQTPRMESAAPTLIPQTISIIVLTISVLVAAVIIKKKTNSKPNREHD